MEERNDLIKLIKRVIEFNLKIKIESEKETLNKLKLIYIKRFYSLSKALLLLVSSPDYNKYSIIPISIILRTCMSDFITFYYLFGLIQRKPKEYEEEIKRFLAENLFYLHRDISKNISEPERNRLFTIMKNKWPEYFKKGKNEIIKPLSKSISEMSKELIKSNIIFQNAYDNYNYFSKFEHIGILTFELQEYHEKTMLEDFKNITVTYSLYLDGFINIMNTCNVSNQLKKEINELIKSAKPI